MIDQLKLENQMCFPVYALAREIVNHYRPMLDELGVTYPQYLVLMVLWEKQQQTVNQLGEQLMLDSGTLTPLLKRLEQKGIVSRERNRSDERVVFISLTEKGQALQTQAACIPGQLMESLKISMEDLIQLKDISTKILNQQSR